MSSIRLSKYIEVYVLSLLVTVASGVFLALNQVVIMTDVHADIGVEIRLYMSCKKGQEENSKRLSTSRYFGKQSGNSKVCVANEYFIDTHHFQSIQKVEKHSVELDKEFNKAFDATENLIDLPGDAVDDSETHTVLIEISDEGKWILSKMTRQSNELYLTIGEQVITNLIVQHPIDSGKIQLIDLAAPIYEKIVEVGEL